MAPYCRDPEATGAAGIAGISGVRSFSEFVIRDKIKLNQMLRMMAVICDVWPPMAMRGSNANVIMNIVGDRGKIRFELTTLLPQ